MDLDLTYRRAIVRKARALRKEGRLVAAIDLLEDAVQREEGVGLVVFKELAEALERHGSWQRAQQVLDRALAHDDASDPRTRLPLLERKAWVAFRQGLLRDARRIAKDALREARDVDASAGTRAALQNTLGGIAWQEGRLTDAVKHVTQSSKLFGESGDAVGLANATMNLGVLHFTRGMWRDAQQAFEEADRLFASTGATAMRSTNRMNLSLLRIAMGDHERARMELNETLHSSRDQGHRFHTTRAELALARLDLIEGNHDAACERLNRVMENADCMADDDIAQASWMKAVAACDRGFVSDAVHYALLARAMARSASLVESEADCCRALGVACARGKKYVEAERALGESIALADRISDRYRRALALLDLGLIYRSLVDENGGVNGEMNAARQAIDEAARVFDELGARYDLQRARRLSAAIAQ